MEYVDDTDEKERLFEVYYHYEKPEEVSRWLPPSPGMIDYMEVTENGVDVTNSLSRELYFKIEKTCLTDWFEDFD